MSALGELVRSTLPSSNGAAVAALADYLDAAEALRAVLCTEDVFSGLSPREFVRTRVSGVTLGQESDKALAAFGTARAALLKALGGAA